MIEWTGTQNKISVEGECSDPVSVILQRVEQLALKARDSERLDGKSGKVNRTPFASQMRTVRSDDAVYSTPLPLSPPPPHRTTFTLAVCPPNVYSSLRVLTAHTLTVPSFEEDANRGAEGFLIRYRVSQNPDEQATERFAHMCIGSQDKDMIHFECPFSASLRGFPVFGSHIRTFFVDDKRGHI